MPSAEVLLHFSTQHMLVHATQPFINSSAWVLHGLGVGDGVAAGVAAGVGEGVSIRPA